MAALIEAGRRDLAIVVADEQTLTIHVNERRARPIIEAVLRRLGETYFYRTKKELRTMGYPSLCGPQVHVIDTTLRAEKLERLIVEEANRQGLSSLAFEVVD